MANSQNRFDKIHLNLNVQGPPKRPTRHEQCSPDMKIVELHRLMRSYLSVHPYKASRIWSCGYLLSYLRNNNEAGSENLDPEEEGIETLKEAGLMNGTTVILETPEDKKWPRDEELRPYKDLFQNPDAPYLYLMDEINVPMTHKSWIALSSSQMLNIALNGENRATVFKKNKKSFQEFIHEAYENIIKALLAVPMSIDKEGDFKRIHRYLDHYDKVLRYPLVKNNEQEVEKFPGHAQQYTINLFSLRGLHPCDLKLFEVLIEACLEMEDIDPLEREDGLGLIEKVGAILEAAVKILDNWIEKEVRVVGRENREQIKTQLLAIETSLQRFYEPSFSMVIPLRAGAVELLHKFDKLRKEILKLNN